MADNQLVKEEILNHLKDLRRKRIIVDISTKKLPNNDLIKISCQGSGKRFSLYFNGLGCKISIDETEDQSEIKWNQDGFVDNIIEQVNQILES